MSTLSLNLDYLIVLAGVQTGFDNISSSATTEILLKLLHIYISSKQNFVIRQIAVYNCYKVDMVNNLLSKHFQKKTVKEPYPQTAKENSPYKSLIYFGNVSKKISSFFKKTGQ